MAEAASGGRTWWAPFEFTRINIEPIILKSKIEDLRTTGATVNGRARRGPQVLGSSAYGDSRRHRGREAHGKQPPFFRML